MEQYAFKLLTKEEIIKKSHEGCYIDHHGILGDMDGTKVRKYLESKGFTVIKNKDVNTHGIAITDCGIAMSTNGFIYRPNE